MLLDRTKQANIAGKPSKSFPLLSSLLDLRHHNYANLRAFWLFYFLELSSFSFLIRWTLLLFCGHLNLCAANVISMVQTFKRKSLFFNFANFPLNKSESCFVTAGCSLWFNNVLYSDSRCETHTSKSRQNYCCEVGIGVI